jgi:hypothetical protein
VARGEGELSSVDWVDYLDDVDEPPGAQSPKDGARQARCRPGTGSKSPPRSAWTALAVGQLHPASKAACRYGPDGPPDGSASTAPGRCMPRRRDPYVDS